MEAIEPRNVEPVLAAGAMDQNLPTRKIYKRKRRSLGGGSRLSKTGKRPFHKRMKVQVSSSTHAANNIMKFRLGGSVSDPLNLEGGDDVGGNCSTCAPSPATPSPGVLDPPTLPKLPAQLKKDPLNLEGKVKNFPLSGMSTNSCMHKFMCSCCLR